MNKDNVIERVRVILDKETSLSKDSKGYYTGEIYIDYRDMYVEDKETLTSLSEKGVDGIQEYIIDCAYDAGLYELDYVKNLVKEKFSEEELSEYEDFIDDFIDEYVSFKVPEDFVWGSELLVDILISGYNDWDYDFSNNILYKDDEDNDRLKLADGGIKWLIEQQGYTAKQFEDEVNIENTPFTNKFFSTVYDELLNTTTSLNTLTVSVKMTLRELVKLKEHFNNKTLKCLKIKKDCNIGLVDFWLGAGSVVNICLEKDLVIPFENIYKICSDSTFSYNIGNIYGYYIDDYCTDFEYDTMNVYV